MPKYRKRPAIVEASQYRGVEFHSEPGNPLTPDGVMFKRPAGSSPFHEKTQAYVVTIHGQDTDVVAGDWIITEPDGRHHYPCKPDIFEKTYEPALPAPTDLQFCNAVRVLNSAHERLPNDFRKWRDEAKKAMELISQRLHADMLARAVAKLDGEVPVHHCGG